jgi:hypothetical protein
MGSFSCSRWRDRDPLPSREGVKAARSSVDFQAFQYRSRAAAPLLRELHELGPIVPAGLKLWPLDRAPEALRGRRDYVAATVASYVNPASFSRLTAPVPSGRKPEQSR